MLKYASRFEDFFSKHLLKISYYVELVNIITVLIQNGIAEEDKITGDSKIVL